MESTWTRGLHTKGVKNCNTVSLGRPVKCNEGLSEDGPREINRCNNGIYFVKQSPPGAAAGT